MKKREILDENQDKNKFEKEINVVIPVKNRERSRILSCVKSIKQNNLGLVNNIIIVDNSDKPIRPISGVIIERAEFGTWNKAWLLNLGIKHNYNKYIMTIDVDMLLSEEHFLEISKNLTNNSFICDTNVRRLRKENLKKYTDYKRLVKVSHAWRYDDVFQLFNTANGGFQVYPYEFWEKINGIQESLGLYHGSVDNVMYYRARMNGLNIIDIHVPLLHIEHKKQKEENYSESERKIAADYRGYKSRYLSHVVKENIKKNPETICGDTPNINLFLEYKHVTATANDKIQKAVSSGLNEVEIGYQRFKLEKAKPRVLLAVINNYGQVPDFFMYDVINLLNYTNSMGYTVDLQKVSACDVNSMRNLAVKTSLGMNQENKKYDYIMMLDDDHRYAPEFLVNFITLCEQNNWPILTGLTSRKAKPYNSTQYYKLQENLSEDSNVVKCKKRKNKIIDIEASGPVGMLIKTSVFEKIPYPWYNMQFYKKRIKIVSKVNNNGKLEDKEVEAEQDSQVGGDIYFSRLLKKYNIPIKLHLGYSFPHQLSDVFVNRGKIIEPIYNRQVIM